MNNYLFWIDFSDLNQIIYSFWLVGIHHFLTNYGESCRIIHFDLFSFDLFGFDSFGFNLFGFDSFYGSNHRFFDSFWFVLGYRLYRFNLVTNQITKSTIPPNLQERINETKFQDSSNNSRPTVGLEQQNFLLFWKHRHLWMVILNKKWKIICETHWYRISK